jgi:hypothetical protein
MADAELIEQEANDIAWETIPPVSVRGGPVFREPMIHAQNQSFSMEIKQSAIIDLQIMYRHVRF